MLSVVQEETPSEVETTSVASTQVDDQLMLDDPAQEHAVVLASPKSSQSRFVFAQ